MSLYQIVIYTMSSCDIMKLLEFCLTTTYFQFKGKVYEQKKGLAMGFPISPKMANIFMEALETKALSSSTWLRYVDDVFAVIKSCSLSRFLIHLNSHNEDIRSITSFLGHSSVPHYRRLSGDVYRKPTHTDQLLNYKSHHSRSAQLSFISSLIRRNQVVSSSTTNRDAENKHLRKVFSANHYPSTFVLQASLKCSLSTPTSERETTDIHHHSIHPGTVREIRYTLATHNIRTSFKVFGTSRQHLS